jgi:hypothetical protein
LRPAAFFCAVGPPCFELLELDFEWDFWPPRFDAPGELAMRAARSFDMPLSFRASYCFSFFTLGRLSGTPSPFRISYPWFRPALEDVGCTSKNFEPTSRLIRMA